jgi:hypothetical protein
MLDHMTLRECCSLYLESIAVLQRGWRLADSDRSRIQESASEPSSTVCLGKVVFIAVHVVSSKYSSPSENTQQPGP